MKRQETSLPHTGIATFCKAPYVFDPAELTQHMAVQLLIETIASRFKLRA